MTKNFRKIDISEILKPSNSEKNSYDTDEQEKNDQVEKTLFWYHGTNQKNADEIIANGIDLMKTKGNGNYSRGHGFYLTENLSLAIYFAFKKFPLPGGNCPNTIAIVVFTFEEKEDPIAIYKQLGIDLRIKTEPNEDRLRKIVTYFSNGADPTVPNMKDHGLDPNYADHIEPRKMMQFICGPYSSFEGHGGKRTYKNVVIQWGYNQLCLSAEPIKQDFERRICTDWLQVKRDQICKVLYDLNPVKTPAFIKDKDIRTEIQKLRTNSESKILREPLINIILKILKKSDNCQNFGNRGKDIEII